MPLKLPFVSGFTADAAETPAGAAAMREPVYPFTVLLASLITSRLVGSAACARLRPYLFPLQISQFRYLRRNERRSEPYTIPQKGGK
ncbi:hypothetical protein [Brucella vulpis]|uniref:hypothetical protein n=1 Tax=Brucella vulpis TaxID=981386 RepID=UPI000751F50D